MTVSKAYNLLNTEGYIISNRRLGTRVSSLPNRTEKFSKELNYKLTLLLAEAINHNYKTEELNDIYNTILTIIKDKN